MDARSMLLAALLSAAASTSPFTARADPENAPPREDGRGDEREPASRRDRCARMRAYPAWCREADEREARERVRRTER